MTKTVCVVMKGFVIVKTDRVIVPKDLRGNFVRPSVLGENTVRIVLKNASVKMMLYVTELMVIVIANPGILESIARRYVRLAFMVTNVNFDVNVLHQIRFIVVLLMVLVRVSQDMRGNIVKGLAKMDITDNNVVNLACFVVILVMLATKLTARVLVSMVSRDLNV